MKRIKISTVLAMFVLALLSGCALPKRSSALPNIHQLRANAGRLRRGMNREQARAILDLPAGLPGGTMNSWFEIHDIPPHYSVALSGKRWLNNTNTLLRTVTIRNRDTGQQELVFDTERDKDS